MEKKIKSAFRELWKEYLIERRSRGYEDTGTLNEFWRWLLSGKLDRD